LKTSRQKRFSFFPARPCGQTLLEFVLVAMVFFLVVFAVIEMGILVYQYTTISMAAREATRYAAAHSPTSQNPAGSGSYPTVESVAMNEAMFLSASEVTVTYPADPILPRQKDALVTISHTYHQYIPGMPPLSFTLTSSSQMLVSQ
jgi:MFS superfamily sulfate permease-like transporter